MHVNQALKNYLLENPIDRSSDKPYEQAAKALNLNEEVVRGAWRRLRRKGLVENSTHYMRDANSPINTADVIYSTNTVTDDGYFRVDGENAEIKRISTQEIKTLEDLIALCEIDIDQWDITSWQVKRYESWIKNKAGEIQAEPRFSVFAKMRAKKIDTDLGLQKEVILEEIRNHSPKPAQKSTKAEKIAEPWLYEIAIPDLHIGKMAWGEEVGEDYDIKIAIERYKDAIETLLTRVDMRVVGRFLLPVGNDMINIDNKSNTTTAGTPQSADSRFGKMFRTAKNLLIETIDRLSGLAPVDVVVVAGNHDNLSMFTLGEVLQAWYHNNDKVTIDNSPKQRKYYQYGNTAIQFTHGNQEKHIELGMIFAAEEPNLWADTKFRFCQLGHYHHTKKLNYVSVQEHQGFQIQIIPSLSGTDAWHYEKGYNSLKQAKGFLFDLEDGLIGEMTHTV